MTARVEVNGARAQEPVLIQGDQFAGMALLLDRGKPTFIYNPTGRAAERVQLQADTAMGDGSHSIAVKIEPRTSAGPNGARMSLVVDGNTVGSADIDRLYRLRGDTYVGTRGLGSFSTGVEIAEACGCRIESVAIVAP